MTDEPARTYRFWEMEFLGEYLHRFHADADRIWTNMRLGPIASTMPDLTLTPELRRLIGVAWRRRVDALVMTKGELLVIEAKMIPDPAVIGQVKLYLRMVPSTPELEPWRDLPRRGLLLFAVDDPFTRAEAVDQGLTVQVFQPSNFEEWIRNKRAREMRNTRPKTTNTGESAPTFTRG
jgi:hypothetical protein